MVDDAWIDTVPPPQSSYWVRVRIEAARLGSDGCSYVRDYYLDACLEHDIHWRTGRTIDGDSITAQQANRRLRKVIQARSHFGAFSPLSWTRWAGVSISKYFLRPVADV